MTQHPVQETSALQRFSIERLLRLAFQHHLITDYWMTPTLLQLSLGDEVLALDPETARRYLCRIVQDALERENGNEAYVGPAYRYTC